jgi:tRNA (guanosine-2'-O-)-methyltransferase
VQRYASLTDAVSQLRAGTCQPPVQIVAAHPSATALHYRDVDYTLPTALLLGTERAGLSEGALAIADVCIAVPMLGMVESHNVAVAAGIILAEAQHQRQQAGLYEECRLDQATRERLFFEWAHPGVRDFCRQRGLDYPPLDDEGEIVDGPDWYAQVRKSLLTMPPGEGN